MTATIPLHGRRHGAGWCAGAIGFAVSIVVLAATAAGAVPVGKVEISRPNGSAIKAGGSDTVFAVRTPADATCPGDTAHDFYFLDSYFVHEGTSPASVSFKGGLPDQGRGIITDGAYYGSVTTARDTGAIVTLPLHSTWGRLTPNLLFPNGGQRAVWQTGIVCADTNGVVASYWNAKLEFTTSTSDPRGFRWRVIDAASSPGATQRTGWLLALAAAFGVLGVLVIRRRSRPAPETTGRR